MCINASYRSLGKLHASTKKEIAGRNLIGSCYLQCSPNGFVIVIYMYIAIIIVYACCVRVSQAQQTNYSLTK